MTNKIVKILKALRTKTIDFDIDLIPFNCQDLNYKKILNWIKTESSVLTKPFKPWGYPTIIQIEPTNRCNLNCPVCPVSCGLDRTIGDMNFGLFEQLVHDLHHYLLVMLFWDWGEPFLHPRAYDMIRLATDNGIRVMASTNGHLFADKEHAANAVESNLDVLVFSIDGLEQKTYEQFRKSGNLEVALRGVRNVLQARDRQNSRLPLINLRLIVNRFNEHEIPQARDFAKRLGVDVLTLRKFHSVSELDNSVHVEHHFIPEKEAFKLPKRNNNNELMRVQNNPCRNLWNCPTIHWDGKVCSCFMDYKGQRPLGDLKKESIINIWRGAEYTKLRQSFKQNWLNTPICNRCSNGYIGGNVGLEANAQAFYFNNTSDA